jgi:hypothetical protein
MADFHRETLEKFDNALPGDFFYDVDAKQFVLKSDMDVRITYNELAESALKPADNPWLRRFPANSQDHQTAPAYSFKLRYKDVTVKTCALAFVDGGRSFRAIPSNWTDPHGPYEAPHFDVHMAEIVSVSSEYQLCQVGHFYTYTAA